METFELQQLWKSYDNKLEKSMQLNLILLERYNKDKIASKLRSFAWGQGITAFIGVLWIALLSFLTVVSFFVNLYFSLSLASIVVFNILAVASCIRYIAMSQSISLSSSITETQEKLAAIQSSMLQIGKIMMLQTPLFCTFWLSDTLINNGGLPFLLIHGSITLALTILPIYLYIQLKPENMHKKWVASLVRGFGSRALRSSMEFLGEIEKFKAE